MTTASRDVLTGTGVVGWADTDASGWIHFTAPFRWVEEVEHAFYRRVGVDPRIFPRRAVTAEYITPLTAGTQYTVQLQTERLGGTSITWSWTIHDAERSIAAVTGRFVAVHLDHEGRPIRLPTELTRSLAV